MVTHWKMKLYPKVPIVTIIQTPFNHYNAGGHTRGQRLLIRLPQQPDGRGGEGSVRVHDPGRGQEQAEQSQV